MSNQFTNLEKRKILLQIYGKATSDSILNAEMVEAILDTNSLENFPGLYVLAIKTGDDLKWRKGDLRSYIKSMKPSEIKNA